MGTCVTDAEGNLATSGAGIPAFVGCLDKAVKRIIELNGGPGEFRSGDVFVFGRETSGLPESILHDFPAQARLRLPMRPGNRSLNLSNAVAVVVFEAWRQINFA